MTTYAALLRAVNIGAHNKVGMGDLRAWAGALGLSNARTLLQSGNLVFGSTVSSAAKLEAMLEDQASRRLGLKTDFMLRTKKAWTELVSVNPFPREAERDPAHLLVMFLKAAPIAAAVATLQKGIKGRETVIANGRELYIVYPDGIGRSALSVALIERVLGTTATGRNWNTVRKILDVM